MSRSYHPLSSSERSRLQDVYDEDVTEYGPVKFRHRHVASGWRDHYPASDKDISWKRQTKRRQQWKPKTLPAPKKHSKFRGHGGWACPVWAYKDVYPEKWHWSWPRKVKTRVLHYVITPYLPGFRHIKKARWQYSYEEIKRRGHYILRYR